MFRSFIAISISLAVRISASNCRLIIGYDYDGSPIVQDSFGKLVLHDNPTATMCMQYPNYYKDNSVCNPEQVTVKEQEQSIPSEHALDNIKNEIYQLINEDRLEFGLKPLHVSIILEEQAQAHTNYMIRNGWGHAQVIPNGCSENIQRNAVNNLSADFIHSTFMKSTQGHRENILDPHWKYVGIGLSIENTDSDDYYVGKNGYYITERFCTWG